MNATRRRRRTFQPEVDSLEGRVVLNAAAPVDAAHTHAVQVQEQRELKHEVKLELQKEKHTRRNDGKFAGGSVATSGVLSVTGGTPIRTTSSGSSGAASTRTALQVHGLAPNNLNAANLAFQGMSVGVETSGSVGSHRRTSPGGTTTTTTGTGTTTTSTTTGTATTSSDGDSDNPSDNDGDETTSTGTTTTISPTSGNIGTVTITLPTTATSSSTSSTSTTSTTSSTSTASPSNSNNGTVPIVTITTTPGTTITNTTGGSTPGSGSIPFINL